MTYRLQWQVEPRAGELIGRGISTFGEAMGQGIAKSAEIESGNKERDKKLKEDSDRYGSILEAMGVGPGEVSAMSLGQKKGAVDAFALKRAGEVQQEEVQQKKLFQQAMNMAQGGEGKPAMPVAVAMQKVGVTDPRLIQAGISMQEAMGSEKAFQPRLVDLGNGRQAMTTSDKSAVPLQEAMGATDGAPQFKQAPDGSWVMVDARGRASQLKQPGAGGPENAMETLTRAKLEDGLSQVNQDLMAAVAAPGNKKFGGFLGMGGETKEQYVARLQQKRIDLMRQLQGLGGGAPAAAPGAAPAGGAGGPGNVIDFNNLK